MLQTLQEVAKATEHRNIILINIIVCVVSVDGQKYSGPRTYCES